MAHPYMKSIIDKFYEIEGTQGTNAKKAVLEKYRTDEAFKYVLQWYFNNLIVTGLKTAKIDKSFLTIKGGEKALGFSEDEMDDMKTWGIIDLLQYLEENNTGRDMDALVVLYVAGLYDQKTREGIIRIATKSWDKGLGIGRTICNNVYGDTFLPIHEVMLCASYFDNPDYYIGQTFGYQVKLDGFRMTIFKKGDKITVLSRSGKDQTGKFPLIEEDVRKAFKGQNVVLDGERMPIGFMEMDSKQQYKLVSNSTKKGGSTEVCLAVYDYMPLKDWENRKSTMTYSERYSAYQSVLTSKPGVPKYEYLFPLPCMYIGDDIGQIEAGLAWAKENEKEGIIVKDMAGFYEWDRTIACAKVKSFFDMDVVITDMTEGKGKLKGAVGALYFDYKGNKVKVGTGLKEEQRFEMWNNKKAYIGKTMEIVYFEETTNKAGGTSLRFPVFKCIKNGD